MNSIQLELFSQEVIRVGVNHRACILCFKFEKQEAWSYFGGFCQISSLQSIIKYAEGPESITLLGLIQLKDCTKSWSHEFWCPVGTWKKLDTRANFQLISGVDLFALRYAP